MKPTLSVFAVAAAFVGVKAAPTGAPTETTAPHTPSAVSWIFFPHPTGAQEQHGPRVINVGQVSTVKGNGRMCEEWKAKVDNNGVATPYCVTFAEEPTHKGNYNLFGAKVRNGSCAVWDVEMVLDYVAPTCDYMLDSTGNVVPQVNQYGHDSPGHVPPHKRDDGGPASTKPVVQNIDMNKWEPPNHKMCLVWQPVLRANGTIVEPDCQEQSAQWGHTFSYQLITTQLIAGECHNWQCSPYPGEDSNQIFCRCTGDSRDGGPAFHQPPAPPGVKRDDPDDDNDEEDSHPDDSIFNTYSAHQRTTTTERLEVDNKVCKKWTAKKLNSEVTPRHWKHFKPECKKWHEDKSYGHQTYTLATVAMHYGTCWADQWDIKEQQNYVEPHCSHWLLQDVYMGDEQVDGYDVPDKKSISKRWSFPWDTIIQNLINSGFSYASKEVQEAIAEAENEGNGGGSSNAVPTDPRWHDPPKWHPPPPVVIHYEETPARKREDDEGVPSPTESEAPTVASEAPHAYSDFVAAANGWDPDRLPVVHFSPVPEGSE